jgi:hypothetical protein
MEGVVGHWQTPVQSVPIQRPRDRCHWEHWKCRWAQHHPCQGDHLGHQRQKSLPGSLVQPPNPTAKNPGIHGSPQSPRESWGCASQPMALLPLKNQSLLTHPTPPLEEKTNKFYLE